MRFIPKKRGIGKLITMNYPTWMRIKWGWEHFMDLEKVLNNSAQNSEKVRSQVK